MSAETPFVHHEPGIIVVDDWKAKMWAPVLPKMQLNEGAVVREGGLVGWAFRQCTEQKLDQQDCSRTSEPQRCQINKQAAAACRDKAGADHMTCLRGQFSGQ